MPMTKIRIDEIKTDKFVSDLVALENSCFTTDKLSAQQFRRFIKTNTALIVAVWRDEKLIAAALILFRKNSTLARLYSIAVNPEFQRQGIADALLTFIEQKLKTKACTEIRLEVRQDNQRALCFYQKNNYEYFGEYQHFYEDGANATRMRKKL